MFGFKRRDNRKWQARPQLYQGRFFYVKQMLQMASVMVLVLLVMATVLYFKNSEALSIRSVEVLGDLNYLSRQDVLWLSEIKKDDKLFALNLSEVQKKIKRHPWVKSVSIRREFPDTIQIYIEQRRPVALLITEDMYLVDDEGVVFKKRESTEPLNLPAITGFKTGELKQYSNLMRYYLNFCLTFLSYMQTQGFYKTESIAELHFDRVGGLTVYTRESGLEIFYGRDHHIKKQLNLEKFKLSKEYNKTAFVRIDLDSADRVIARKL